MAEHAEHQHAEVGLPVYFGIFAALLVGTGLTVYVAYIDLGGIFNDVLAVTIACVKASLVVLYFMHVRYGSGLMKVFAGAGFLWLILLFSIILTDYVSRDWAEPVPGWVEMPGGQG